MPRFKMKGSRPGVPSKVVQLTDAEETARDAEEAEWENREPARAFERLRSERNRLLAETDFYANSDVTMSDDMKAYRKALRDLPASYNNSTVVGTITWPEKP